MADTFAQLWVPPRRPHLLSRVTAPAKLCCGALLALWVVLVDHPLALGLPVLVLLLSSLSVRLNRIQRWLFWGAGLLVIWSTVLSQGFFYQRVPREALLTLIAPSTNPAFPFEGLRIYREGLLYGFTQSLRLVALLWMGLLITFTTEFHALLGGLQAMRVPPGLGLLTIVAARSLPALAAEALGIQQALRIRHLTIRKIGWAAVVRPLLAGALRRASHSAASLAVRGIDPAAPNLGAVPALLPWERVALSGFALAILAVAALRLLMFCYLQGWWYQPDWLPLYVFAGELMRPT